MNRFFLWLSGADRDLLARCTSLTRTERLRFAGLGSLVLIPALLGIFSMSYAISTIASSPVIYVGLGLAWGVIVMIIDRYLISTLHKSSLVKKRSRSVSIVARYVFAVLVGLAVSHPLVLLWFDDSISQQIDENRRVALEDRRDEAEEARAAVPAVAESAGSAELNDQLAERTAFRDCLIALQADEQAGVANQRECGSSSGSITCGPRCAALGTQIETVNDEIDEIRAQLEADAFASAGTTISAQEERDTALADIDEAEAIDIAAIETTFSDDYLARVEALGQLGEEHSDVKVVTWFIVIFFVFVDILPVTMKLATSKGEYEEIRDTLLMERRAIEGSKQKLAVSGVAYEGPLEMRMGYEARKAEFEMTGEFLGSMHDAYVQNIIDLSRHERDAHLVTRGDDGLAEMAARHGEAIRDVFEGSWDHALARVKPGTET